MTMMYAGVELISPVQVLVAMDIGGRMFRNKPRLVLTKKMEEHENSEKAVEIVMRALKHFPEFRGKTITLGVCSNGGGRAISEYMKISLNPKSLSMMVTGHELTHLLQGKIMGKKVPYGEVTCDIWTIARNIEFADKPLTYLNMPIYMKENWLIWKGFIRSACRWAIKEFGDRLRFVDNQRFLSDYIRDKGVKVQNEAIKKAISRCSIVESENDGLGREVGYNCEEVDHILNEMCDSK